MSQIPAIEVTILYSNKTKGLDNDNYDRMPKLKRLSLQTPYLEKKRTSIKLTDCAQIRSQVMYSSLFVCPYFKLQVVLLQKDTE